MATKAQIQKRKMIAQAKQRKADIQNKYEKHIPKLQRSGNVRSIIRKVEQIMTQIGIKRKRIVGRGKRTRCTHFSPLNYMEGNLVKMGRR